MKPAAVFLLTHLALVPFGLPAAFHPSVRDLSSVARVCAAFGFGAVLLTLEAVVFSLLSIPWTVVNLAVPLLVLAVGWTVWLSRRPGGGTTAAPAGRRSELSRRVAVLVGVALALALAHLALLLVTARATSLDFLFFWGVKALRFANAGGIDLSLLQSPFFSHAVPEYPPLATIVHSWAALSAGEMPWRRAPMASWIWFAATLPLVYSLLRRVAEADFAAAVTGFWGAALVISLGHSYSGGNAEAPLLFYETLAGAALITEPRESPTRDRWLAALALAGAVLTKVEGLAAAVLLILGVLLRDRLDRRPARFRRALPIILAPGLALASWFGFQAASGLPVGYRGHGRLLGLHLENAATVAREMLRNLDGGTWGLSWILPAALIFVNRRRLRPVLPALVGAVGLLAFFAFDYLHDSADPWERIGWTLPRVSQPALSLMILAAGAASFGGARTTPGATVVSPARKQDGIPTPS